ncbi:protein adenylyltransferase SelO family protein, partial [Klebsiella pneumoniae]
RRHTEPAAIVLPTGAGKSLVIAELASTSTRPRASLASLYGFMERFRPNWINNHSDYQGRYTYQNQPSIAHWNLWTWLNNLIPLAEPEHKEQFKEALAACLEEFEPTFIEHYTSRVLCSRGNMTCSNYRKITFLL